MKKGIEINVEKDGFPINFGTVEFFFSTAAEELSRFFEKEAETQKQMEIVKKKIKKIKQASDSKVGNKEQADQLITLYIELEKIQYDALLGEGAFDKIYEQYPSVQLLEEYIEPLAEEIASRIQSDTKRRKKQQDQRIEKLLKKKQNRK